MNFERVLICSPHTDDGELAAGGTIARFLEEGKDVFMVVFCGNYDRTKYSDKLLKRECLNSSRSLGIASEKVMQLNYELRQFPKFRQEILEDMVEIKNKVKPSLVLVPSSSDRHQDHNTIYSEAIRAFKKEASIWGYEHPWNNLSFTTDIFIKLERKHLESKIRALKCYKSQLDKNYFNTRYIRALSYTRGMQVNLEYAEAFELVRMLY